MYVYLFLYTYIYVYIYIYIYIYMYIYMYMRNLAPHIAPYTKSCSTHAHTNLRYHVRDLQTLFHAHSHWQRHTSWLDLLFAFLCHEKSCSIHYMRTQILDTHSDWQRHTGWLTLCAPVPWEILLHTPNFQLFPRLEPQDCQNICMYIHSVSQGKDTYVCITQICITYVCIFTMFQP